MTDSPKRDRSIHYPMNRKHRMFAEAYIKTFNVRKAAEEVNYSKSHAGRIINRPDVQEAIEAARANLVERTGTTADAIINEIKSIAFSPIRVGIVSAGDKIRALDLLGRYLKLWDGGGQTTEIHVQTIELIDRSTERHQIIDEQNGSAS